MEPDGENVKYDALVQKMKYACKKIKEDSVCEKRAADFTGCNNNVTYL